MKKLLFIFILLGIVSGYSQKRNPTKTGNATEDLSGKSGAYCVAFGFGNETGTKILAINQGPVNCPMQAYTKTIGEDFSIIDAAYIGKQASTPSDNHRQHYFNFPNTEGSLFETRHGKINHEKSSILFSSGWLKVRKIVKPLTGETVPVPVDILGRIEKFSSRKVLKHKVLFSFSENRLMCLVEYAQEGNPSLANLVYVNGVKLITYDYTGRNDDLSTWRVDDEGKFGVDYYKALIAFETETGVDIFTDWPAPEGTLTEYFSERNGKLVRVASSYRYIAPR
jgi:hypothetical protein